MGNAWLISRFISPRTALAFLIGVFLHSKLKRYAKCTLLTETLFRACLGSARILHGRFMAARSDEFRRGPGLKREPIHREHLAIREGHAAAETFPIKFPRLRPTPLRPCPRKKIMPAHLGAGWNFARADVTDDRWPALFVSTIFLGLLEYFEQPAGINIPSFLVLPAHFRELRMEFCCLCFTLPAH